MENEKIRIFESYEAMCREIAVEIRADLKDRPRQLLCIAAGNTSLGVFKELIRMYREKEIDFSKASFVAMDEWVGMDETTPGSCGNFLVKYFLKHVNYPREQVRLWNGKAADLEAECRSVENFIRCGETKTMDYLVLGSGMNGHLALNEPGADFHLGAHVHELDDTTKHVGQKYFETAPVLERGITLGIRDFRAAKRTVLMSNGSHKREIAGKILAAKKADSRIPATALYDFPNGSIYCDAEASSSKSPSRARNIP